ncbi:hypothetical protein [Streptomyces cacaoi]|uniref:hypothetical protein n=1 Tax=Streptomyces cacaoi TaxID=1898 RepID=UPI00374A5778
MRTIRFVPVLAAAFLVLTGCANSENESEKPAGSPADASSGAATPARKPSQPPSPSRSTGGTHSAAPTRLKLTTPSGSTALAPTDVYCSGEPGELRHLIGRTNHRTPLVKVVPGEFAMVELGHGRPYKSSAPTGVSVEKDGITFAGTKLGNATLEGTVTCTRWQD